jgi:hypothetical protein
MLAPFITYRVEPLRSGLSDDRRVPYISDRLQYVIADSSQPADVLAALLAAHPTTNN